MSCLDVTLRNTVKHNPPESYGNCHSICFAAIMGLVPSEVPHFYERGDEEDIQVGQARIVNFLAKQGWKQCEIAYPGEMDLDALLNILSQSMPGVPFILGGTSSIGAGHSVVALDGTIVLDPTGSGIVGPLAGYYFVTILMPDPGHWQLDQAGNATAEGRKANSRPSLCEAPAQVSEANGREQKS